jgi:hypothetical protein
MTRPRSKPPEIPERPKNDISAQLLNGILAGIGDMFYPGRRETPEARKTWAIDQNFYKRNLVMWAARWLDDKGVTIGPETFKKILLEKLLNIKTHSAAEIQYLPRYLAKCIQDHFKHNKDEIYARAKSVTAALDNALARATIAQGGLDPIRILALAHQVAKQPKKHPAKAGQKAEQQLSLF